MSRNILKLYSLKNCNLLLKRNLSVCIVGAGPSGFYAAMHLSKLSNVNIDIIEKLPVPFGLIRYGVAPDHPEVKNVINQFTKVAEQPNVHFYGNISLGKDISLAKLRQNYNAVLLTYGAEEDKLLGIENENVNNVIAARNFVGWYNGLPHDKNLQVNLSASTVAIFGQGNVALDVARILLTPVDDLKKTDITEHALNGLAQSKIKEVYLVGRRGPLQVAFTIKELREQLKLKKCTTIWNKDDFTGVADIIPNLERPRKRLTELMLKSVKEMNDKVADKYFKPKFYKSPNKILINSNKNITGVELTCNKMVGTSLVDQKCVPTDKKEILECQLMFRSIGYKSVKVDSDLNFDCNKGIVCNNNGRVIEEVSDDVAKLYVAGWLSTGPTGVILHTMGNAFQVAKNICDDLNHGNNIKRPGIDGIKQELNKNNTQIVDWNGWKAIDKYEVEEGKKAGKPREKICDINKMLEIAIL